jgi:hypothetical protein
LKAPEELSSPPPEPSYKVSEAGTQAQTESKPEDLSEQQQSDSARLDEPEPRSEQKPSGGRKKVAENNREGMFDSINKMSESVFSLEGVKKAAAWYIETSEKLANQALELQERATGWAKDTPFAPLFEAQNSFARKFVERSANAARTLWQIHPGQYQS